MSVREKIGLAIMIYAASALYSGIDWLKVPSILIWGIGCFLFFENTK